MYTPSGMGVYPVMGYPGHGHSGHHAAMGDTRDGFQEYGTFAESNGVLDAIAAVAFDPVEELVWTGSHTVRGVFYIMMRKRPYSVPIRVEEGRFFEIFWFHQF